MRTSRRLTLAGIALLAAACEHTYNPQPEKPSLAPAVVAGYESSGTFVGNVVPNFAWLWSPAGRTDLTERTLGAYASAVACAGTEPVAAGALVVDGTDTAAYWKGGRATVLGDGIAASGGLAVVAAGAEVHVAGYVRGPGPYYPNSPTLWHGGVTVTLETDSQDPYGNPLGGVGTAIGLAGADVLVAGDVDVATLVAPNSYLFTSAARLWRNGVGQNITDGFHEAHATGLAVSGGDVYVSGFEADDAGYYLATVWKNGVTQRLPQGSHGARATAVALDGSDVYVTGLEANGTTSFAKYWKNGVPVALGDGIRESAALSVAVVETGGGFFPVHRSVLVAGYEVREKQVAMLWRDGVATALSDGKQPAAATGVVAACQ